MNAFRFRCFVLFAASAVIGMMLPGHVHGITVVPERDQAVQYEWLPIHIRLQQPFRNPYDPEDITVDAVIRQPGGDMMVLPCFYKSGDSGASDWEARFTGMKPGLHAYCIRIISGADSLCSKTQQIEVLPSERDGFLRLCPGCLYAFRFDSGRLFRGTGLNLGWELQTQWPHTYETYFSALEKEKANFARIWMCPWNLPLEWTRVLNYDTFTDELESWDRVHARTPGLTRGPGLDRFTEDDTSCVTIDPEKTRSIVYHLADIRRFRIKLFYKDHLSRERIRCLVSGDGETWTPVNIEFSQTWNTHEDWHRLFVVYIDDLPDGADYLKIMFLEGLEGSPHLGSVLIEHGPPRDILDAPGLGRYYQETAGRFDEILDDAAAKGIYVMLAHDYHGTFKSQIDVWASNAEWRQNPYNAANGGPCSTQEDFFTDETARRYYKNRLRYMVARWGACTHLAVWEFWNEIDNVMDWQQVSGDAITDWHREMAAFLKETDPYDHLVSTSVVVRDIPGLWEIDDLDFTQHHNYGQTGTMKESILHFIRRFGKPDVVGEYALGWKGPGKDHPAGMYEGEMHDGLWRGVFSPTPVLPMTWWWEWHYHQGHFFHFGAASAFTARMLERTGCVLQDIPVTAAGSGIETLGLRSGDTDVFVWIKNTSGRDLTGLNLMIPDLPGDGWNAVLFDTRTGAWSPGIAAAPADGGLVLGDLRLKNGNDTALWLHRGKDITQ